jgi:hypothetical protein
MVFLGFGGSFSLLFTFSGDEGLDLLCHRAKAFSAAQSRHRVLKYLCV